MSRGLTFAPDEYYHVFNRGNEKQTLFKNKRDYARFLFLLLHLQSPEHFINLNRQVDHYVKHLVFNISAEKRRCIAGSRLVEVSAFALMPNHFHLLVREIEDGGISRYMHRISNAYGKYFNEKYEHSGHCFQGTFKAVHVEDDHQLTYLSTYIHRNPRELREWHEREHDYPWSSYRDYLGENRWGDLLVRDIVLGQFPKPNEYRSFVDSSIAKDDDYLASV